MSYTVYWASTGSPGGKPVITIAERTFDATTTSLVLTGKGLQNYGKHQQQNFVRLLENFAATTSPANPTTGQLWYDTAPGCMMVWNSTEWQKVCCDSIPGIGLGEYGVTSGLDPDPYASGFSTRINRLVGTPHGAVMATEDFSAVWGWGLTDKVPTYIANGSLSPQSVAWEPSLPGSEVFPLSYNNNAWAIAISRLRKAMRQVGLDETDTSPIGFINDGLPSGTGNTLANAYNNSGALADILAGYGSLDTTAILAAYNATVAALDDVEYFKFSLGASQTTMVATTSQSRTSPADSLTIPSSAGAYVHSVKLQFANEAKARAFFNAGGQVQFEPSFVPSGAPTNVEQDWDDFLTAFSGFCFDYKGMKKTSAYETPLAPAEYFTALVGGTTLLGFYDLTSTPQIVFVRDVIDTPGLGIVYVSPTNGGIVIKASKVDNTTTYDVIFDIEYVLDNVTTGTGGQNDLVDVELTGTLTSDVSIFHASTANYNSPNMVVPTFVHSGTFLTAP